MSWTTRPSLPSGHKVTAAEVSAILDQISALTAPDWTSYADTFAWTSTGTQPALGDATVVARYRRPVGADLIVAEFSITFGGTSTYGTGDYFVSLPVAASAGSIAAAAGSWYALDVGTQHYSGVLKISTSTTLRLVRSSGVVGATAPFTFASGDVLSSSITYEPA